MQDAHDTQDTQGSGKQWGWDMPVYDDEPGQLAYHRMRRAWLSTAIADARQDVPTPADINSPATPLSDLLLRELNGPRGVDILCAMVKGLIGSANGAQVLQWLANEHAGRHWRAAAGQLDWSGSDVA